ncbi:hypothetical protein D9611_004538 [Ephemerocybe angulata]|uniref:PAZ domain-containing protein n=1 Tax=Ephemerocybe angulata TaxID=980116 RepID=A0A8H5BLX5_9AGAR|nr:hypothetical protein D9611_004538 [Tulosesus angulatus]
MYDGSWRKKAELVRHLQVMVEPEVFTPQFLYDGEAFRVRLGDNGVPGDNAKGVYVIQFKELSTVPITATWVSPMWSQFSAETEPRREITDTILNGRKSARKESLLNFMQLIVRQASNNDHPSNKKAYYPFQCDNLGFIELRRGIFHSVRPAIGKMILVVDTTVAAFYTGGDLIDALLKFFESRNVRDLQNLSPGGLKNAERCFKKVIITETKGTPPRAGRKRTIKGFHPDGALFKFTGNEGEQVTIEQHYMTVHNVRLAYPRLPGVVLRDTPGREEIVPMELCKIEPGQFYKKALPENVQSRVLTLSTMKPVDKMSEISKAVNSFSM